MLLRPGVLGNDSVGHQATEEFGKVPFHMTIHSSSLTAHWISSSPQRYAKNAIYIPHFALYLPLLHDYFLPPSQMPKPIYSIPFEEALLALPIRMNTCPLRSPSTCQWCQAFAICLPSLPAESRSTFPNAWSLLTSLSFLTRHSDLYSMAAQR